MDRLACVNLRDLPLQILYREHPEWREAPTVVIAREAANARITYANAEARAKSIYPGMTYAAGLSIFPPLYAQAIEDAQIHNVQCEVLAALRKFTPYIEPASDDPGVFWLNASGLIPLFESLSEWGQDVTSAMTTLGFVSDVAVGFSKLFTAAITKIQNKPVYVYRSPERELEIGQRIPIECLRLPPELHDDLRKLDIRTIGDFVKIPAGELLPRYGRDAYFLHGLASQQQWSGLTDTPDAPVFETHRIFDHDVKNSHQLLFAIKRDLPRMLSRLAGSYFALRTLRVDFTCDSGNVVSHELHPADPTLDEQLLLRLVHLRLDAEPTPEPVVEMKLAASYVRANRSQLALFQAKPKRDLSKAKAAIASIRSMLGNGSTVVAVLQDRYLPEYQYQLKETKEIALPAPGSLQRQRIRAIYSAPAVLPKQHLDPRNDGWLLSGLSHGSVMHLAGPFRLWGGWWKKDTRRDYYFIETHKHHCLWVYFDRTIRRWILQGALK